MIGWRGHTAKRLGVLLAIVALVLGGSDSEPDTLRVPFPPLQLDEAGWPARGVAATADCTSATVSQSWDASEVSGQVNSAAAALTATANQLSLCYALTTPPPFWTLALTLSYPTVDQAERPVASITISVDDEVAFASTIVLSADVLLVGPGVVYPAPTAFIGLDKHSVAAHQVAYTVQVDGLLPGQSIDVAAQTRWDNVWWPTVYSKRVDYGKSADLSLPWLSSVFFTPLPVRQDYTRKLHWHIQTDADVPVPVQLLACLVTDVQGCVNQPGTCQTTSAGLLPYSYNSDKQSFKGSYRIGYGSITASAGNSTSQKKCTATYAMVYLLPATSDSFAGFAPVSFNSPYSVIYTYSDTSDIVAAVFIALGVTLAIVIVIGALVVFLNKPVVGAAPATNSQTFPTDTQKSFPTDTQKSLTTDQSDSDRCALLRPTPTDV